jgi:hypothetical protein
MRIKKRQIQYIERNMTMNKARKIMIVSTMAAIIAGSGALALNSGYRAYAEPTEPPPSSGPVKHRPAKDAPKRDQTKAPGAIGAPGRAELCRPVEGAPSTGTATGSSPSEQDAFSVAISGGFDTDPLDHGRPVVLIAAALGVPAEVFREAFSGVTPAGLDSQPSSELAQRNKAALLKVLAPYGITNERLDEVSDYYRYNGRNGETWQKTRAAAVATVSNGVVTGITITNPGSGYSSTPTVTVTGPNGAVTATAAVSYTKDFKTNGSISAITIK